MSLDTMDPLSRFAYPPVFEVVGHVNVAGPTLEPVTAAGSPDQARAPKGTPIGGQWIWTPKAIWDRLTGGTDTGPEASTLVESAPTLPRLAGAHKDVSGTDTDKNGEPYGEDAAEFANRLHERSVAIEPQITRDMTESFAAGGMDPSGLEYRIKEQDSLARKIRDDIPLKGDAAKSAAGMWDGTRYTAIAPAGELTGKAQSTLDALRERGYMLADKKPWAREGNPYRGINMKVLSPQGDQIELQFHTPESLVAKFKMHPMFDDQRLMEKGSPEWEALNDEMWAISGSLEEPPGIDSLT